MMYESFATTAPNDISMVRCLTSARAILAVVYQTPNIASMAPLAPFLYRVRPRNIRGTDLAVLRDRRPDPRRRARAPAAGQ